MGQYSSYRQILRRLSYPTPWNIFSRNAPLAIAKPSKRIENQLFMVIKECTSRVGTGYDVHKLVPNRKLIIGGVSIEYKLGALGFSDADVLIHAIADALLGAAALGDIGQHFPDTDKRYEGMAGSVLLAEVLNMLNSKSFSVVNIDSTVILQSPKISEYILEMRKNISHILQIDISKVSVKATTTEMLGFIGENKGIAAQAIALLESKQ